MSPNYEKVKSASSNSTEFNASLSQNTSSSIYSEKIILYSQTNVKYAILKPKKWIDSQGERNANINEFLEIVKKNKYVYEYFPKEDMVFCLDIDRKYKNQPLEEEINKLLQEAKTRIITDFNLDNSLEFAVCTNHRPINDNEYKVSFHLVIPSIKTKLQYLRDYAEDNSDIFDKSFASRGFLRFATSKKVFDDNNDPKIIEGNPEDFILANLTKAKRPFIYGKEEEEKEPKKNNKEGNKTEVETIKKILDGLSDSRASDYDDWIKVGMILKNELDDDGIDLWALTVIQNHYKKL